jgi:hypothetical protein
MLNTSLSPKEEVTGKYRVGSDINKRLIKLFNTVQHLLLPKLRGWN